MAIGVDIEDISRFKDKSQRFLDRIYTKSEQEYCLSKPNPPSHFAVRFCAKEAAFKALHAIDIKQFSIKEIEVYKDEYQRPQIRLLNDKGDNLKIEVSLSHDKTKAIAFVTISYKLT